MRRPDVGSATVENEGLVSRAASETGIPAPQPLPARRS